MRFRADLHIHSHFSRATSKFLVPEYLDYWAGIKGIQVVGTGDFTHPGWLAELKESLESPPSVLGDTTIHAIQSGIFYGYSGLVDCIIEKTEQEVDHKLPIVATGGLSQKLAP